MLDGRQDSGAVPDGSTISTWMMKLKKYIVYFKNKIVIITSNKLLAKKYASVYDGAEIRIDR